MKEYSTAPDETLILDCEAILGGILTKGAIFALYTFINFFKEISQICNTFAGQKTLFNA